MAMNMDALLRIKAAVTGSEAVTALGKKFGQVQAAAVGLTRAGGLAGGALAALAPVATIGGLTAMVNKTIQTASSMYDLSQRTGVSVEMLGKFNRAAKLNGTSLDAVVTGIGRLQKSMVAAASSNRFGEKTKEEMEQAVEAVRSGERRQTQLLKDQADQRLRLLEGETDKRMDELSRRYRNEEQMLNDQWDDQSDAAERAADRQTDAQIKAVQREFDYRRDLIRDDQSLSEQAKEVYLRNIEDQEDQALNAIRDRADEAKKVRQRAARDEQQVVMDALNDRRKKEEGLLRSKLDSDKSAIQQSADMQIKEIARVADAQAKALQGGTTADDLAEQMDQLGLSGKGASKIFAELGVNIKNADGSLRSTDRVMIDIADAIAKIEDPAKRTAYAMALFGRGGGELVGMLSEGGQAIDRLKSGITTELAKNADQYTDSLIALSGAVAGLAIPLAELLLPSLKALSEFMVVLVRGFRSLPGPVQGIASALAVLGIAATSLATFLAPLGLLLVGLAGTGIKTAIVTSLGGVLTWIGTTFVPGLLAFFTGPVGWITLAAIAVGLLVYRFREPIGKFFVWMGETIKEAFTGWWKFLFEQLGRFSKWFDELVVIAAKAVMNVGKGIIDGISGAWNWLKNAMPGIAETLSKPFGIAVDAVKAAFRGLLQFIASRVNVAASLVNFVIRGYNRLPTPDLPEIPLVQVPSFAGGGYTGSGPRSGGIDGRGGFMAMLHPQETVIDHTRGAAAALGGAATAAASAPSITIQTGPIYRLPDGTDTVSVGDLQAAMQATAAAVMGQLRRPGAQLALGIR